MNILALDVGGTAIKSALIKNGVMIKTQESLSDGKRGGKYVLENIMKTIDLYEDYEVIGISTTGQVDSKEGSIIYANENVPNYTGTQLAKIISERYNKPIYVENDVNAAAMGEGYYGAGKNEKDFLCLTYGTGIGGAISINKEIYKGSRGCAGEMGHIITHLGGLPCNCGQLGCYEQYASTTALVRNAMTIDSSLSNGKTIFTRLEQGDLEVKNLVDSWIEEIIYGLVNLIHIFNPSCIILGGGILMQPYILQYIHTKLPNYIMDSFQNVNIKAAELGNHAGIYGMVAIAERELQR